MESGKSSNTSDLQANVLVIGSGASGLPAAVRAAETGAKKVILIDRRKILGGTARIPGSIFAVASPVQKRLGINHTVDEIFKAHMDHANWMCESRLVRTWMNESGDVIRWLEDKGVKFGIVSSYTKGPIKTNHQLLDRPEWTGNAIVDALVKACKEKGVQVLLETRARKLITDKKGNVTGVLADQKGKKLKIAARSVVIATGPISGNKKLMKKYFPHVNFATMKVVSNLPANTGDGFLMAQEVGAAKDGLVTPLWIGPCEHPFNINTTMLIRRPHVVLVNKYGLRYVDETFWCLNNFGPGFGGMALDRQPGRMCYALFDHKTLQDMIKKRENVSGLEDIFGLLVKDNVTEDVDEEAGPAAYKRNSVAWLDTLEDTLQTEAKAGRVKISNSWDEISQWMGADPEVLKNTVDQYNAFCKNGHDAEFLKPKEYLLPLNTPPYYAIGGRQGLDGAYGGIRINHRMEVLSDGELKPIGGLYAVGILASGWTGPCYGIDSEAYGFSVFSGYAAGKNAAAYAKSVGK